jgi:chromosome segregation protein
MLKRLELVGFKSFADKTQFDFSPGITAIVGPNGSGKSNVVDAVRWVLGEQSAKSLRGGEMADVIFNGSTSRRSLGLAEVTMTFDNGRRVLATEADEVQITRRVYRDGEGEYLVNQQLARLKDIKDLFLGSGAGGDAYCVIEQGRVDVLLQASTKERRTIFEEAAGISRFKAKKLETLRKLERVDQNLQRLKDITEEVDKQLRSVKLQAAKAQRYQEYGNRLKELRISLGFREFDQLTAQLAAETAVVDGLRTVLDEQAKQVEACEAETAELERTLRRLDDAIHEQEGLLGQARQQIASAETTWGHERALSAELDADLARIHSAMMEITSRVAALFEASQKSAGELAAAQMLAQEQEVTLRLLEEAAQAAIQRVVALNRDMDADKAEHLDRMRQAAQLQNEAVTRKAQLDNLRRERQRLNTRTEQAADQLTCLDVELRGLLAAEDDAQVRLVEARSKLVDERQEQERLRQALNNMSEKLADLRAERSGLVSRLEVLEGLERTHEGLGTGVQEVLALLASADPGPWQTVLGIVADFVRIEHQYAPLLDVALGERAQRFLVHDIARLEDGLRQRGGDFSSRVSFVPITQAQPPLAIDSPASSTELAQQDLPVASSRDLIANHPGVIAPAERLVSWEIAELSALGTQLLGNTLVVRDLVVAREISASAHGYRFVTLQGELLEADGTLTVGNQNCGLGIVSRKSELRELRQHVAEVNGSIAATEGQLTDLRNRLTVRAGEAANLQGAIDLLGEQTADLRTRIGQHRQRREGLQEEVLLSNREIGELEEETDKLERAWEQARTDGEAAEQQVLSVQVRLEATQQRIRDGEQEQQSCQQQCTAAHVLFAQTEERLSALRAKERQLNADLEQRRQERSLAEEQVQAAHQRMAESQSTMLQASSLLAHWYLRKEAAERTLRKLAGERDVVRVQRQALSERAQGARAEWQTKQEQAHARALVLNDLRHNRDTLVQRLGEDYDVDLVELYDRALAAAPWRPGEYALHEQSDPEPTAPPLIASINPQTVHEEIAELRQKLTRLGSVNLDALEELAGLESRASTLHTQSADLVAAKQSLEEIIAKINRDSRRQFSEAFQAIRSHFHELFRKLFGGGTADILLEDENDVLESGIEVIARPPGKELLSISLMSGGEKTLTAVALLLAIFRSKPSPFCILDEVDAALDEANIGRFTAVLREFLDQSHFILITHSKRTMAVADVLYGITMQESGVSKRVAVRFDDWPENAEAELAEATGAVRNGHDDPRSIPA